MDFVANRRKQLSHKKTKKKFSADKKFLVFIFANCVLVELFAMAAMWRYGDLSSLYCLIGPIVGGAYSYKQYTVKATKENTAGGITYDSAMQQNTESNNDSFG